MRLLSRERRLMLKLVVGSNEALSLGPILDVGAETDTKDCYIRFIVWLIKSQNSILCPGICAPI